MPFRSLLAHLSGWPDIRTLKAENFADATHRHVGAASLIAKSERDRLMRRIAETLGQDVGSGYAGDPLSRAYVLQADPGDPYVRWSWITCAIRGTDAPLEPTPPML